MTVDDTHGTRDTPRVVSGFTLRRGDMQLEGEASPRLVVAFTVRSVSRNEAHLETAREVAHHFVLERADARRFARILREQAQAD